MEIYLKNNMIDDMKISDSEFGVYIALKSIYQSSRENQYVTYNMLMYELAGNFNFKRSLYEKVRSAFESLVDKNLITIIKKISSTEFIIDLEKLYFSVDSNSNVYYTVIYSKELQKIINLSTKADKFKLLRYFVVCLRTVNRSQGVYKDCYSTKQNFVGFMTQDYLSEHSGIDGNTLLAYNKILMENKLLYIYKHTELKRDMITGQFKSFSNHYGRYEDKEDIIAFARNYAKICGVNERIVQSEKANRKRSVSAKYNNLRYDFGRYVKQYSDDELIEIYKQIHHDNKMIQKDIDAAKKGSDYQKSLLEKLRDEEIFNNIPCVVDYIDRKHKFASASKDVDTLNDECIWGEPDAIGL